MPLSRHKSKTHPNLGRAFKTSINAGTDVGSYAIYFASLVEPFLGLISAGLMQAGKIGSNYSTVRVEVGKYSRPIGTPVFGTTVVETKKDYNSLMEASRLCPSYDNDLIILDPGRMPPGSLVKKTDTTGDPITTPTLPITAEIFPAQPPAPGTAVPAGFDAARPASDFGVPIPSDANTTPAKKVDNRVGVWEYAKGNPWKSMSGQGGPAAGKNTELTVPTITLNLGKHNIDHYLNSKGELDPVLAIAVCRAEKEIRESYGTYNQPPVYIGTLPNPSTGKATAAQVKKSDNPLTKHHYEGPILIRFEGLYTDPNLDVTPGARPSNQIDIEDLLARMGKAADLVKELAPLRYNALLLKNAGKDPEDKDVLAKIADANAGFNDDQVKAESYVLRDENGDRVLPFRGWAGQKLTERYNAAVGKGNAKHNNSLTQNLEYLMAGVCLGTASAAVAGFGYILSNYIAAATGGLGTLLPGIDLDAVKAVYGPEFRMPGALLVTSLVAGTNWRNLHKMRKDYDVSKTKGMGNVYCSLELR